MKNLILLCLLFAFAAPAPSQNAPKREVYRIHFFKAGPGKLKDLIEAYTTMPPAPPGHESMIFRHQSGDDWDLLVVYPQGEQAHIDANPNYSEATLKLRARVMGDYVWHTDTYATGPSLEEVKKALSVPKDAKSGVFLVEDYRALDGHLTQLDDILTRDIASARAHGSVRFDHVQGAPWDFLVIFGYSSWQEYVAAENDPKADDAARKQGFKDTADISFALRAHIAEHHDTFVSRIE
jgi:hypothetical protein